MNVSNTDDFIGLCKEHVHFETIKTEYSPMEFKDNDST